MRAQEHQSESIFASIRRTVREIIGNAPEIKEIIRSEVQLAKTEIKEEVRGATKVSAFHAAAAISGLYALGLILLACVYGLSHFVQPWLAALIVGLVMAAIGGIAYMMARKETQQLSFKAEQTLETAKENVRWAKNRFK